MRAFDINFLREMYKSLRDYSSMQPRSRIYAFPDDITHYLASYVNAKGKEERAEAIALAVLQQLCIIPYFPKKSELDNIQSGAERAEPLSALVAEQLNEYQNVKDNISNQYIINILKFGDAITAQGYRPATLVEAVKDAVLHRWANGARTAYNSNHLLYRYRGLVISRYYEHRERPGFWRVPTLNELKEFVDESFNPDAFGWILSRDLFVKKVKDTEFDKAKIKNDFGSWSDLNSTEKDSAPAENDLVNHPKHYTALGFEVLDFIHDFNEALEDVSKDDVYFLNNAIKYLLRCNFKGNKLQDLRKAEFYLKRANGFEPKNDFNDGRVYLSHIDACDRNIAEIIMLIISGCVDDASILLAEYIKKVQGE